MTKIVGAAMAGLKPRQREVLEARFGLEKEGEGETLAAIGDRLKVTRERVRQIEGSGIALAAENVAKDSETIVFLEKVKKHIAVHGGVEKKSDALQYATTLVKGIRENQLDFLSDDITHVWALFFP